MVNRLTLTFFNPCCQRIRVIDRPLACNVRTYCRRQHFQQRSPQLPRYFSHPVGRDRNARQQGVADCFHRRDAEGFGAGRRQPVQLQRNLGDQDHRQPKPGIATPSEAIMLDFYRPKPLGLIAAITPIGIPVTSASSQRDRQRSEAYSGTPAQSKSRLSRR